MIASTFRKELDQTIETGMDWTNMKTLMSNTADTILGKNKLEPMKPWMTQDILDLIAKRNKLRKSDQLKYKEVKNLITQKCRHAKEIWLQEHSEEIEFDIQTNRIDKAYFRIKKMQSKSKTKSHIVKDKDGRVLFEIEKVAERWKEYIEELYHGEEAQIEDHYIEKEDTVELDFKGPDISGDEFNKALMDLNEKKACRNDAIPSQILKNLGIKAEDLILLENVTEVENFRETLLRVKPL